MLLLRDKLLAGRRLALSGGAASRFGGALGALGAEIEPLEVATLAVEEERTGEWARGRGRLDGLLHDAGAAFGAGGQSGLRAAVDEAWAAVREVAIGALIESPKPGKLVLMAPRPDDGPLGEAAGAELENLARSLSVEWARYGVTAVMVAPGPKATDEQLAQLVGFLVSEAGGYFSGCRVELGR